ncbi:MAG: MFS transporter, partial [Duncaniella sp.]|nr:MFS transporter [Duncaniella sp.]
MFKNQPAGLYILSLANTGERFGYYTMLAIFLFFLQAKFGFDATWTGQIFSIFLAMVYFLPVVGGWLADKWSFSKCVISGICVMFVGYALMSAPTPVRSTSSMFILFGALALIAIGTGLFKGNLQVMVGDLYNEPRYAARRDAAFSLFYMAINLGSMFAPMAAISLKNLALSKAGFITSNPMAATVCNWCLDTDGFTSMPADGSQLKTMTEFAVQNGMPEGGDLSAFLTGYLSDFAAQCGWATDSIMVFANDYITTFSTGCCYAFALACGSLIISFLIYTLGRRTYSHIITDKKAVAKTGAKAVTTGPELSPEQTRQRVVALFLVFAVVIFFWMVFHQNGQTLTEFAKSCTSPDAAGWTRIGVTIWALGGIAGGVDSLCSR